MQYSHFRTSLLHRQSTRPHCQHQTVDSPRTPPLAASLHSTLIRRRYLETSDFSIDASSKSLEFSNTIHKGYLRMQEGTFLRHAFAPTARPPASLCGQIYARCPTECTGDRRPCCFSTRFRFPLYSQEIGTLAVAVNA